MTIGVDVVEVARIRDLLARSPSVEERLLTPEERSYCRAKADPARHVAGTVAAKEAVIKALDLGPLAAWSRRIEIRREASGRPVATVGGITERVTVSISHDGPVAIAIAQRTEPPRRPSAPSPRPNEQLRRFVGA